MSGEGDAGEDFIIEALSWAETPEAGRLSDESARALLRAHDDRIRAEVLRPLLALADQWERQARSTGKAGGDTRNAQFAHSRALRAAVSR